MVVLSAQEGAMEVAGGDGSNSTVAYAFLLARGQPDNRYAVDSLSGLSVGLQLSAEKLVHLHQQR